GMLTKPSVLNVQHPPSDTPGLQAVAANLVPDRLRSCVRPCVAADLRRRVKMGFRSVPNMCGHTMATPRKELGNVRGYGCRALQIFCVSESQQTSICLKSLVAPPDCIGARPTIGAFTRTLTRWR